MRQKIKRMILKILIFVVALVFLWVCSVTIDFYRFTRNTSPLFTHTTITAWDGGTRIYNGLGYKITFNNQRMLPEGRRDRVFEFGGNSILAFERTMG